MLAPWDLTIEGPVGFLSFYANFGPPPSAQEWARLQQRLQVAASAPPPRNTDLRPVLQHILYERRLGALPLEDDQHQSLTSVLSNIGPDLAARMIGQEEDLETASALFGVASACDWYAHDPDSADLLEELAVMCGEALDELRFV